MNGCERLGSRRRIGRARHAVSGLVLAALCSLAIGQAAFAATLSGYAGLKVTGEKLQLGVEGEIFFVPGASIHAEIDWATIPGVPFGMLGLRAYAPEPEGLYGGVDFGSASMLDAGVETNAVRFLVGWAFPLADPSLVRLELASVTLNPKPPAGETNAIFSVGFGRLF